MSVNNAAFEEKVLQNGFRGNTAPRTSVTLRGERGAERAVYTKLFEVAASRPTQPIKDGPLSPKIDAVLAITTEQLLSIHAELTPQHLHPDAYSSKMTKLERWQLLDEAGLFSFIRFRELSRRHLESLIKIGTEYAVDNYQIEMGDQCLDVPPFFGRNNSSKCSLFSFLMIANSLLSTETKVSEDTVHWAVTNTQSDKPEFGNHIIDFDVYANVLTSPEFAALTGMHTEYLQLRGATLGVIGKIAAGIKRRNPGAKVYCTVPVQSDVNPQFWHQVVIIDDTGKFVRVHNPGGDSAMPLQSMGKLQFYRKWAACMNLAHIFISVPFQLENQ